MYRYKNREEFIKALGVSEMPEVFGQRYDESMAEYDRVGVPFLSDEYLDALQGDLCIFEPEHYDFVKRSAKRVRENEFLARYSLLMYHMQLDKPPMSEIYLKEYPKSPDESLRTDYQMAAFFSQLANARQMVDAYIERGVPEDIISDTIRGCYEGSLRAHEATFGCEGFHAERSFGWNQLYTNHRLLRIGVLNFELRYSFVTRSAKVYKSRDGEYKVLMNDVDISATGHTTGTIGQDDVAYHAVITETDDYIEGYAADHAKALVDPTPVRLDKKEWSLLLDYDVHVIGVHIPTGVAFTRENLDASYKRCVEVLKKSFPEFKPKAFTCFSWLIDPQLKDMLKPTSNIVAFQSQFTVKFPKKSFGTAVYTFLFKKHVERIEDLCEDTSLQRTVKKHYLEGKYIYEPCGVLFDYLD